jgi:DNA-binding Xre family transcriptional regulator
MKWNLRFAAAHRDIWKASELQRLLAERGLVISAGKMSGLWSGQPVSLKLDDLDVICAVLGCQIGELLVPEPDKVPAPASPTGSASPRRPRVWLWCPAVATAARCRRPESTWCCAAASAARSPGP